MGRAARIVRPGEGAWLGWNHQPLRHLITGEETEGRYAISLASVPAGVETPPRRHPFAMAVYVLSGEVRFFAGREEGRLPRGGFLHLGPSTWHRLEGCSPEPARLLMLFAPAGYEELQRRLGTAITGPDDPALESAAPDPSALRAIAGEYGVEFEPTEEAWSEEPELTLRLPGEGPRMAVVGDLYRFLAEGEQTGGRYALWHATVPPGGGPPPHVHSREDEGFFVLAGEVEFTADGLRTAAGPGTYVHLPIGSLHAFRNARDQVAEMLILVGPAGLEGLFRRTGVPLTAEDTHIPAVSPEEISRLLKAAPQFGVEIRPPH